MDGGFWNETVEGFEEKSESCGPNGRRFRETFCPKLQPYAAQQAMAYLDLQTKAATKIGDPKHSSSFLKATTTTLMHMINESEKASYVSHINKYLGEDTFLKNCLPVDRATNDLFNHFRMLFCCGEAVDGVRIDISFPILFKINGVQARNNGSSEAFSGPQSLILIELKMKI